MKSPNEKIVERFKKSLDETSDKSPLDIMEEEIREELRNRFSLAPETDPQNWLIRQLAEALLESLLKPFAQDISRRP